MKRKTTTVTETGPLTSKILSPQKLRFVKEYIENKGNATEAALAAYPINNRDAASNRGSALLKEEDVQIEIQAQLEAQGVSIGWIIDKHKNLVETSDNDMVKTKNLEDLADYSRMFPRKSNARVDIDRDGMTVEWGGE